MPLPAALGLAVRRERQRVHLSQERLAEVAGLDRAYLSGLERGVRNPTLATIGQIAEALSLSVSELLLKAEELSE